MSISRIRYMVFNTIASTWFKTFWSTILFFLTHYIYFVHARDYKHHNFIMWFTFYSNRNLKIPWSFHFDFWCSKSNICTLRRGNMVNFDANASFLFIAVVDDQKDAVILSPFVLIWLYLNCQNSFHHCLYVIIVSWSLFIFFVSIYFNIDTLLFVCFSSWFLKTKPI